MFSNQTFSSQMENQLAKYDPTLDIILGLNHQPNNHQMMQIAQLNADGNLLAMPKMRAIVPVSLLIVRHNQRQWIN